VYAAAHRPSSAPSDHDDPLDYVVLRSRAGELRKSMVVATPVHASFVQPFGDGALLVSARCTYRRKGPDRNALIVDAAGQVVRRLTLGDGISDVRVTADGSIWVSYFDEGVFGNHGWSSPGPAPMGQSGLVGFDGEGLVRFTFDATAAQTGTISDAYAMNVTPEGDVWVYYYTDFPIVRIRAGAYQAWKLGVAGAHALAVATSGSRALLVGGYKERSAGRLLTLGDAAAVTEQVVLTDHHGDPLDDAAAFGVGDKLYFFQDRLALELTDW
jgi:hypothetical protein